MVFYETPNGGAVFSVGSICYTPRACRGTATTTTSRGSPPTCSAASPTPNRSEDRRTEIERTMSVLLRQVTLRNYKSIGQCKVDLSGLNVPRRTQRVREEQLYRRLEARIGELERDTRLRDSAAGRHRGGKTTLRGPSKPLCYQPAASARRGCQCVLCLSDRCSSGRCLSGPARASTYLGGRPRRSLLRCSERSSSQDKRASPGAAENSRGPPVFECNVRLARVSASVRCPHGHGLLQHQSCRD